MFLIEEFAAPYYALKDAGFDITLASPKDGKPLIDPISETINAQTKATKRFDLDKKANTLLAITHQLSEVNENDFDAIFYPDEHGVLWNLIENGGIYSKISNWQPYAVEDANLISGQTPRSSEKVAECLIEKLKA